MKTKKLLLKNETIRSLSADDLDDIHGGLTPTVSFLVSAGVRVTAQVSARYCSQIARSAVQSVRATLRITEHSQDQEPKPLANIEGPRAYTKPF